jgi:hypothetical protein
MCNCLINSWRRRGQGLAWRGGGLIIFKGFNFAMLHGKELPGAASDFSRDFQVIEVAITRQAQRLPLPPLPAFLANNAESWRALMQIRGKKGFAASLHQQGRGYGKESQSEKQIL